MRAFYAILFYVVSLPPGASPTSKYWIPDSNWENPDNWDGRMKPNYGDVVTFKTHEPPGIPNKPSFDVYVSINASLKKLTVPRRGRITLGQGVKLSVGACKPTSTCHGDGTAKVFNIWANFWSHAANWRTESFTGDVAAEPPCGSDTVYFGGLRNTKIVHFPGRHHYSWVYVSQPTEVAMLVYAGKNITDPATLPESDFVFAPGGNITICPSGTRCTLPCHKTRNSTESTATAPQTGWTSASIVTLESQTITPAHNSTRFHTETKTDGGIERVTTVTQDQRNMTTLIEVSTAGAPLHNQTISSYKESTSSMSNITTSLPATHETARNSGAPSRKAPIVTTVRSETTRHSIFVSTDVTNSASQTTDGVELTSLGSTRKNEKVSSRQPEYTSYDLGTGATESTQSLFTTDENDKLQTTHHLETTTSVLTTAANENEPHTGHENATTFSLTTTDNKQSHTTEATESTSSIFTTGAGDILQTTDEMELTTSRTTTDRRIETVPGTTERLLTTPSTTNKATQQTESSVPLTSLKITTTERLQSSSPSETTGRKRFTFLSTPDGVDTTSRNDVVGDAFDSKETGAPDVGMITGIAVGGFVSLTLCLILVTFLCRRRNNKSTQALHTSSSPDHSNVFHNPEYDTFMNEGDDTEIDVIIPDRQVTVVGYNNEVTVTVKTFKVQQVAEDRGRPEGDNIPVKKSTKDTDC